MFGNSGFILLFGIFLVKMETPGEWQFFWEFWCKKDDFKNPLMN
jgi:hypothetical protein